MIEHSGATISQAPAPSGFLQVADLEPESLHELLVLAEEMEHSEDRWAGRLDRRLVACIYEKHSTRTRVSFAVAAHRLGMRHIELRGQEMQLARGETMADTGGVLSEYVDLIVLRTYEHDRVRELADGASVPVINALSNTHHPCQALADLLTLQERFGGLAGLRLAFVGDASSNVAHSILQAAALTGMTVVVAAPERYWPDPSVLGPARLVAARHGGAIELVTDPRMAVRGAHAVYPEIWVPMDKEADRVTRLTELGSYQVDAGLMALCHPDGVFMHCLPAFRGQEVTSEVLDGPRSVVRRQAANRTHTAQALMYQLITRRPSAEREPLVPSAPVQEHAGGTL
jgi:ornithine carbamoyltransferase